MRGPLRSALLAAAFALLVSGCAVFKPGNAVDEPSLNGADDKSVDVPVTSASGSASGNYLAGRFAGATRDTRRAARYYALALRQDPDNDIILDRAFLLELAGGQVESAMLRAEIIAQRDPTKRLARLALGLKAAMANDMTGARVHLTASASGPFNTLASRLIAAWTYEGEGRTDEALAELGRIDRTAAFDLFRAYHTALILDHAGQEVAADKAYVALINAGGGGALRVVQAYGGFLERHGRGQDAGKLYAEYAAGMPDNPLIETAFNRVMSGTVPPPLIASAADGIAEALYGLASALAQDRSVDLPIVYLQITLYVRSDFDVAQMLLGDLLSTLERWREANGSYEKIESASPLYESARIQMALNLDRTEQTDKAVAVLEQISTKSRAPMRALTSLGDLLRSRERFDDAANAYGHAISLITEPGPRYWSLYYARGVSYERAGKWDLAEQDLKEARRLDPEQPLVLNYLGYSWIEKGEHLTEAVQMIERAVAMAPNDGYIVDSLGWANYKLGNLERAVEYLERAVSLRPEDPTINEHLGDAYWKSGRTIEARFQWRHSLALGADKKQVPDLEKKINFGLEGAAVSDRGTFTER